MFVHQHYFWLMVGHFRFRQQHIRHNNHDVALLHQARRCAVQAHHTAAALAGNGVGFKALAIVVVDDGDFFVNANTGGIQQILVNGDAADIIQIGFGNGGAVNLAAEHGTEHGFLFLSQSILGLQHFRRPQALTQAV